MMSIACSRYISNRVLRRGSSTCSCLLASVATSHSLTSLLKNRLLRIFVHLLSEMADEVSVVSWVSISLGYLF